MTMNAPLPKHQISFTLGDLTYINSAYEDASPSVIEEGQQGIHAWISDLVARFTEWQDRRAVTERLAAMSDRELADIGLTRADLTPTFDPITDQLMTGVVLHIR